MARAVFSGDRLANGNVSGIDRVTSELLFALDDIVDAGEIAVAVPKDAPIPRYKRIETIRVGKNWYNMSGIKAKAYANYWRNVVFKACCRNHGQISVNMNTANKFFVTDIVSIYDCRLELFPNLCSTKADKQYRNNVIRNQRRSTQQCKLIMTDSESAKADIVRVYGAPEEKVLVVPCGWQHFERVGEDDSVIERLGLQGKEFFFSLGSRLPHKNIRWVAEAAKRNPQRTFVVSGDFRATSDIAAEGDKPSNLIFAGYLSDEEVKALMRRCRAFVHPSFYEGFGLPPMEAMSVGADCIVSDRGSLPEVYGESVWYIDPYDYDHIDLDEIMGRPKEPNERVLERYSWEKSARILLDAVRELAG